MPLCATLSPVCFSGGSVPGLAAGQASSLPHLRADATVAVIWGSCASGRGWGPPGCCALYVGSLVSAPFGFTHKDHRRLFNPAAWCSTKSSRQRVRHTSPKSDLQLLGHEWVRPSGIASLVFFPVGSSGVLRLHSAVTATMSEELRSSRLSEVRAVVNDDDDPTTPANHLPCLVHQNDLGYNRMCRLSLHSSNPT